MKSPRWESPKYRAAAKGQDCKLRLPGCRNETETVVLAHRNGAGIGYKSSDHDAVDACGYCHDLLDRRAFSVEVSREEINEAFNCGRIATMVNRIERGILK